MARTLLWPVSRLDSSTTNLGCFRATSLRPLRLFPRVRWRPWVRSRRRRRAPRRVVSLLDLDGDLRLFRLLVRPVRVEAVGEPVLCPVVEQMIGGKVTPSAMSSAYVSTIASSLPARDCVPPSTRTSLRSRVFVFDAADRPVVLNCRRCSSFCLHIFGRGYSQSSRIAFPVQQVEQDKLRRRPIRVPGASIEDACRRPCRQRALIPVCERRPSGCAGPVIRGRRLPAHRSSCRGRSRSDLLGIALRLRASSHWRRLAPSLLRR